MDLEESRKTTKIKSLTYDSKHYSTGQDIETLKELPIKYREKNI